MNSLDVLDCMMHEHERRSLKCERCLHKLDASDVIPLLGQLACPACYELAVRDIQARELRCGVRS